MRVEGKGGRKPRWTEKESTVAPAVPERQASDNRQAAGGQRAARAKHRTAAGDGGEIEGLLR